VAVSMPARSRAAARTLFADLRGAMRRHAHGCRDAGEELVVGGGPGGRTSLGVVGESIVLGFGADVVARIAELEKQTSRADVARQRSDTASVVRRLLDVRRDAPRQLVGVFDLDARELGVDGGGRHAGVVLLDEGFVRLEMLSPL